MPSQFVRASLSSWVWPGRGRSAVGDLDGAGVSRLFVLSGLTPLECLASATSEPARAFGFHDRGRIAEGMRADLLLINGDPTVNITATRDIVGIWKLGVSHPRHSADRPTEKK